MLKALILELSAPHKTNKKRQTQSEHPEVATITLLGSVFEVITFREVAQLGRALGLGPRGRRFESCLPDNYRFLVSVETRQTPNL